MTKSTLFWTTSIVLGLAFLAGAGTLSAQDLALSDVQPDSGAPGDPVELLGRGFDLPAAAYFAWGFDRDRGFAFEVIRKRSTTRLDAVVLDPYADVEGTVVVWEGRRSRVRPLRIGGGRFEVNDGFVFEPRLSAHGPSFTAKAGAASGFSGRLVDGTLRLDLAIPRGVTSANQQEEGDDQEMRLGEIHTILVDVAGESCGPPAGGQGSEGGSGSQSRRASGFGGRLRIECRGRGPCLGNPTRLVVQALEGVLGNAGVEATAEGSTVVVSQELPMCGGMLNATVSPAPAQGGGARQGGDALVSSRVRSSAAISR